MNGTISKVVYDPSRSTITHAELTRDVYPHALWYIAPNRTSYEKEDGPVSPYDFAVVMNNAKEGEGLLQSVAHTWRDHPWNTRKKDTAHLAEKRFEEIRREFYPQKPSRLRCIFLSWSQTHAEERAIRWGWTHKSLIRCHLVRPSNYHFADVRLYERYANGELCDSLAHSYWKTWEYGRFEDEHGEMLVDSDLYFPDWRDFSSVSLMSLVEWTRVRQQP